MEGTLPLLLILVGAKCLYQIAYPLYSAAFIVLFAKIRRPSWLDTALSELASGLPVCGSCILISATTCSKTTFMASAIP